MIMPCPAEHIRSMGLSSSLLIQSMSPQYLSSRFFFRTTALKKFTLGPSSVQTITKYSFFTCYIFLPSTSIQLPFEALHCGRLFYLFRLDLVEYYACRPTRGHLHPSRLSSNHMAQTAI